MDKEIKKHIFMINIKDGDGEALTLTTRIYPYVNGGIYTNQELTLQGYCNKAVFDLVGAQFTPTKLRKLANELEATLIQATNKRNK